MLTILEMMDYVGHDFNVFTEYNVNEYMSSVGLAVSETYKGLGIGKEILLARYKNIIWLQIRYEEISISNISSQ